ncbi:hypothetical protein V2I01_37785 [Micromonospora sp. BRA006-A]|nr:hypothetical protein [Micromonospora sp. BRA006-A]
MRTAQIHQDTDITKETSLRAGTPEVFRRCWTKVSPGHPWRWLHRRDPDGPGPY